MTSPHEHLRDLFNKIPRYHRDPDFDRTVQLANEGKHGSYMKLKKLEKQYRNEQKTNIPR